MKKSCEIICPIENYESVIEVLQRFRINYEDEYSIIEPPNKSESPKVNAVYGIVGSIIAVAAIALTLRMLYWMQIISYPIGTFGQLDFDFVASLPIVFELTILSVVVVLFVLFLFSNQMLYFHSTKHGDSRTIYIDVIYNLELLESKLRPYNVVIKHAQK